MATTAQPYIAHLYDRNLVFKRTLGGAAIINKPGLKLTQNAGYQQITLKIAASLPYSPNLLDAPSSTFETGLGNWTGAAGWGLNAGATVVTSADSPIWGTVSMRVDPTNALALEGAEVGVSSVSRSPEYRLHVLALD